MSIKIACHVYGIISVCVIVGFIYSANVIVQELGQTLNELDSEAKGFKVRVYTGQSNYSMIVFRRPVTNSGRRSTNSEIISKADPNVNLTQVMPPQAKTTRQSSNLRPSNRPLVSYANFVFILLQNYFNHGQKSGQVSYLRNCFLRKNIYLHKRE